MDILLALDFILSTVCVRVVLGMDILLKLDFILSTALMVLEITKKKSSSQYRFPSILKIRKTPSSLAHQLKLAAAAAIYFTRNGAI